MAKLSTAEQLDIAIRIAARECESQDAGPLTNREVAERFYDTEQDLIEPFVKDWAIDKLASMIGAQRIKLRPASPAQMYFESLGFAGRLPAKIPAGKQKVAIEKATLGQLRTLRKELEYRRMQVKRPPSLVALDEAILLMEQYTDPASERKITWGEVVQIESAKLASTAHSAGSKR